MTINNRYKQKRFKDFSGGAGQKVLNDSGKFSESAGFVYNEIDDVIELQVDFGETTKNGSLDFFPKYYTQKSGVVDGYLMYALSFSNSVTDYGVKVYIVGTNGVHYLSETFQDVEELSCAFNFNNIFIIQFYDSNLSTLVLQVTSNYGGSWTQVESPFHYFSDFVVVDDILYVSDGGSIFTTNDGLEWEVFYMPKSGSGPAIFSIDYYRGYLHFIGRKGSSYSLGYFIGNEIVIIRQWHDVVYSDMISTETDLILMIVRGDTLFIYSWDFDILVLQNSLIIDNSTTAVKILGYNNEKIYFILEIDDKMSNHIFLLTTRYSFFDIYEHSFWSTPDSFYIYNYLTFENVDYFFCYNEDDDDIITLKGDLDSRFPFNTEIKLITSIFKSDNTCVPKQLILKHDPLPEYAVIKIYVARDKDAFTNTFDTLLITNDVKDSIRTNFNCPKNIKFDSIAFKIVIEPLDLEQDFYYESSPKNIELNLLYKEIGLEVAN